MTEEAEAVQVQEPARRPVLSRREGLADYLLREYSAHEIGEVRSVWDADHSASYSLRVASGRAPSAATVKRIELTAFVYHAIRRIDPDTHAVLRAAYFGPGTRLGALRPALRRYADFYDAMV